MSEHGYCDKCGKDLGDHPTVNVEGINTLALCQERAVKWQRVEPGYVIPAGQPYRLEYGDNYAAQPRASEFVSGDAFHVNNRSGSIQVFIDSSWVPPLVLPTEPTWGIAVETDGHHSVGRWVLHREELQATDGNWIKRTHVADFIPLTDEQVARIEAAR